MKQSIKNFELTDKVVIITGGAGLLGTKHAEAVVEAGAKAVLWDINEDRLAQTAKSLGEKYNVEFFTQKVDITSEESIQAACDEIIKKYSTIDILINNAANDPKVSSEPTQKNLSRFENFPNMQWENDIKVGLTGAYLCSKVVYPIMKEKKTGVILNIASDLGVIAPDQRLYRQEGLAEEQQNVKPVTYSVVKHGLIGLTKYLSTYLCNDGIRVNAISPGGVYTNQPQEFLDKLENLIPMGRMANENEYKSAVVFLCSDASSYMTGQNLIMDGGRSVW